MARYRAGELIRRMREQAGLTQEQLADGIMDRTNLARLEAGTQSVSKTKMDELLNRLGHSSERFFSYVQTNKDFEIYDLRDRLDAYMRCMDTENAEKLMSEIEVHPGFQTGPHRKYLLASKAGVYLMKEIDPEAAMSWLREAIHISLPRFEERLVGTYLLTREDIEIISMMAIAYYYKGQMDDAIVLLEKLAANIRKKYRDEKEKARMLSLVLYNLTKFKGLAKDYNGSLAACNEAIEGCLAYTEYVNLPYLAVNKAYALFYLGDKETSKELIHQAYYCFKLMGIKHIAEMVKENALNEFNISITS